MAQLRDSVREQLDEAVRLKAEKLYEILKPTQGRWLGMLEGDHRWDFTDATSVDQMLCGLLRCPFLGTSALLRLSPPSAPQNHPEADCIIYAHHGVGSARKLGGHLNSVEAFLEFIDADIYLAGHSHAKVQGAIDMQVLSPDGVHYHRTKFIARTGSWLRGYGSSLPQELDEPASVSRGSYVEQRAYSPSALGGLFIEIGYEQVRGSKFYRPTIHGSI
jgi:hypothetical protein